MLEGSGERTGEDPRGRGFRQLLKSPSITSPVPSEAFSGQMPSSLGPKLCHPWCHSVIVKVSQPQLPQAHSNGA